MPKTIFTAEELSTFIRKSIAICVGVTIINGAAIFLTTCVFKKENAALQSQISANSDAVGQLNTTVTNDITADSKWREEFSKANPKAVVPKVIQPTPSPEVKPRVQKATPPPTVIVIPSPPPVVQKEYRVRTKKIYVKPTATPYRPPWWKRSR